MTLFKKAKPIDAMKHFALFLLALILSGVMALSHVSAGSTAPSDIGITRVTELKAAEIDGIRFESIMPEPVLTIPKKQPDTNGVIALGHVPRLLAGAVDAELGRATELTSFESTHSNIDSNAVERNGIRSCFYSHALVASGILMSTNPISIRHLTKSVIFTV